VYAAAAARHSRLIVNRALAAPAAAAVAPVALDTTDKKFAPSFNSLSPAPSAVVDTSDPSSDSFSATPYPGVTLSLMIAVSISVHCCIRRFKIR